MTSKNNRSSRIEIFDLGLECEPNSWRWVDRVLDDIETDTEKYPWKVFMEELWQRNCSEKNRDKLSAVIPDRREIRFETSPVESLQFWRSLPSYPPPEVLMAIEDAFAVYFRAEGRLSLEEVFFGPVKKGVGNYAARKAAENQDYATFDHYVESFPYRYPELKGASQIAMLEKFFEHKRLISKNFEDSEADMNIDLDSFMKGYRRWRKRKADAK